MSPGMWCVQPGVEPADPARASTNIYAVLPDLCDSTNGSPPARWNWVEPDNHRRVQYPLLLWVPRPTGEA
jgi:hypothetical protein